MVFFEKQSTSFRTFLNNKLSNAEIPFTFRLESMPVLQNEQRGTCEHFYIHENFIQNKFLTRQGGQRFIFKDQVIMNLFNLEQTIYLSPSEDMVLKV
jgi:hypothetical protein